MNKTQIEQLLRAAADAQRAGQPEQAARLYRDVLARGGEQPIALNALGMQAIAAGDFVQAGDLFRRAIAVDPRAIELWMNLATASRRQSDDEGEKTALDGALAIDQRHFMALVRLAQWHERHDEPTRAGERWRNVLAMAPMMDERTPALEELFAHATDYVALHQAHFAAAIDTELATLRAEHSPAERRRFEACIDHFLGRRQIYPNVCAGLHVPFLPAEEFFERHHFPWFEQLERATPIIQAELAQLLSTGGTGFKPYVAMEPGTPANKWTALDNQLDWSAFHLWKNGERDDDACARCPHTAALVELLPLARIAARAPTVFFSLLKPGASLPAHTGVSNMRTIIHLPLVVPPDCSFRVGGETRAWQVGRAWAFDDTIEHQAWNGSGETRAILILDVWNPYLTPAEQDLLCTFFPVADRNGY